MTPSRDYVVACVPTPVDEGSQGSGWDAIDESWVLEHAREVSIRVWPVRV